MQEEVMRQYGKYVLLLFVSVALLVGAGGAAAEKSAPLSPRYLAFQIFTGGFESDEMRANFPPSPEDSCPWPVG